MKKMQAGRVVLTEHPERWYQPSINGSYRTREAYPVRKGNYLIQFLTERKKAMTTLRRERKQKFTEILMKYYVGINEGVLNELLDAAESRSEKQTESAPEYFRGDWRDYPEHLQKYAEVLRDTWMMVLPEKPHKGNGKGQYGMWCNALESIRQNCAEFGAELLKEVHADWRAKFRDGIAPYTVAQPTSLINPCSGKAIEKRSTKLQNQTKRSRIANLGERDI
jgi:hypothetical protein